MKLTLSVLPGVFSICRLPAGGDVPLWPMQSAFYSITRTDEELIGCIAARPKDNEIEIGYVLARKFWGQGLMPEASAAIVEWAFTEPAVSRVTALCDVENTASARALEKAGFHREALLERRSILPNISDEPRDCYQYAKNRNS